MLRANDKRWVHVFFIAQLRRCAEAHEVGQCGANLINCFSGMTSPKGLRTTRDSVLIRDLAVQESKPYGCMQYEQTLQHRARNSTKSSRTKN